MKTNSKSENRLLIQFKLWAFTGCVASMLFLPVGARGGGVVTDCTESNLRAALAGGGTVTFACDGTITLASTITNSFDTILNGSGHQVIISGGNAVRVFYNNTNVNFTVVNLTVANGAAVGGAGILNSGGTVIATNCTFLNNVAINQTMPPFKIASGGAIQNESGLIQLQTCNFVTNQALEKPLSIYGPYDGCGGAIYNNGIANLDSCAFTGNQAFGSPMNSWAGSAGGIQLGGSGSGGAIFNNGTLQVRQSSFVGNETVGGMGAYGGGILNNNIAILDLCMFTGNLASSAPGTWQEGGLPYGGDGSGGAIFNNGTLQIMQSAVVGNAAAGGTGLPGSNGGVYMNSGLDGGTGYGGGSGNGGGLYNSGTASLVNITFAGNSGSGGQGGTGGKGGSGALSGGNGGPGGPGGNGFGAIFDTSGLLYLTNCTLALNVWSGGAGGAGEMGGVHYAPLPGYDGAPGPSGPSGVGAGGIKSSGCLLINTLLAFNSVMNSSGKITDAGHNLSSDASCAFTNVGSLNNTDPLLGPLADNGGPTLTMALLPGSPAINAGDPTTAPPTDQRGALRPQGPGVDIGAFEYQYVPAFSGAKVKNHTNFWLQMSGLLPGQAFTLQSSTNLVDWIDVTNYVAGESLVYEFVDGNLGTSATRFYRLKCSTP